MPSFTTHVHIAHTQNEGCMTCVQKNNSARTKSIVQPENLQEIKFGGWD